MLRLFLLCAVLVLAEPCFRRSQRHHCHNYFHHHNWNIASSSDQDRVDWNTIFSVPDQGTTKFIPTTSVQETQGNRLQALQNELIQLEEKLQMYCKETSSVSAKEMYGEDSYYLKYKLPKDVDPKVTVQIKNKLIHTVVTKKSDDHVKILENVKVLPDIVKPEDATWTVHNKDTLKIIIPYRVALGKEFVRDCGSVNRYVIDVPAVLYPSIIYKFKGAEDDMPTSD